MVTGYWWTMRLGIFEGKAAGKYPTLLAEKVDLPNKAGTCNPQCLVPDSLASAVSSQEEVFTVDDARLMETDLHVGVDREEYLKLVVRQLECGKTRLRRNIKAVGSVFSVAKSGERQREVWNGSFVSALAEKPPPPMLLANPSCFVDLVFQPHEEVFMSKRDVHTCFDVLKAPESLQPWFGRPPVTLFELQRVTGFPVELFLPYVADVETSDVDIGEKLYPASTVWPMGFSWSSCVAQASTVACCVEAGVRQESFLCMDSPPPAIGEACGVATDDTFFFHTDKVLGLKRLKALDAAFERHGMPKNATKDVTLQDNMTALGCKLSAKPGAAEPVSAKMVPLFLAWLGLLSTRSASPLAVNRALGVQQWFCLLSRPLFSILDRTYEFVRQEPGNKIVDLPGGVCAEIAVSVFLMPLLGADLERQYLPLITACDASPDFGFGVAYMKCQQDVAEQVGRLAERRGDFVKFFLQPGEPEPKDRLGVPHLLPFHQKQFSIAISAKAKFQAHSGALEAHGLLLALKWLCRRPSHFHHRLVVLIDAKAVLGAASKGRTSAPAIRGVVRHIGALLLATGTLLRLVYVPTEHNPADAPSRGKRFRHKGRARRRTKRSRFGTVFQRRMEKFVDAIGRLKRFC